jgi:hypothetical protein
VCLILSFHVELGFVASVCRYLEIRAIGVDFRACYYVEGAILPVLCISPSLQRENNDEASLSWLYDFVTTMYCVLGSPSPKSTPRQQTLDFHLELVRALTQPFSSGLFARPNTKCPIRTSNLSPFPKTFILVKRPMPKWIRYGGLTRIPGQHPSP